MGLGSAMCSLCGDMEEDTLHVLRDCPLVMPLWLATMHYNMRNTFFVGNVHQWIVVNMNHNLGWNVDGDWKVFWETACQNLWKWHNKELHDDNFSRPHNSMIHVYMLLQNYRNTKDI